MFLKASKDILASFRIIYPAKALSPSNMKTCVHMFKESSLSYSGGEGWWWKTDAQEFVLKELTVFKQAVRMRSGDLKEGFMGKLTFDLDLE